MTTRPTGKAAANEGTTEPRGLRRVVFGALVGTALEWYDFFIYGTAAALVFNVLFFPQSDPAIGTITAFATFGVGFVFRPLGGILFGHIGDRIGRRATLIITTLVMGLSTGVIGLLPTYETIGVWAPVLLVLLRVLQGLGAGAEFGGASTLLAEHAPAHRRGYYCSYAQTGVQVGLVLATVSFLLVGLLDDEQLYSWGWRVPFLVSFLMIGVALYVRLRVEESPVFRRMLTEQQVIKLPVLETLRSYPRNLLIGVGAHIADTACAYLYATFTVSYATSTLGISRPVVLTGVIIFGVVVIALQPVYGALSDRIGRKPLNLFSMVFTAVFIWPFFLLLQTEQPVLVVIALVIATALGWAPVIAVQPAFYAELFGARVRYSGFATSREVGAALAGFTPLIAAAMVAAAGGAPWVVAAYIAGLCVISLIAFVAAPETKDMDIEEAGPSRLGANR
ncbi:MHS family MFS transporter [Pseudonocardia sp. DSM 110487]|uniref:MFS transporter n=1 Tax=Pseudonocardia sp. DSM 110487 TaxID=2865833 RepID=UPI001C695FD9|nr:MFS transporter [Pseudonocardia sp. DSM 110487]QYN32740.1 MHS family MFS transporter [Pseudonocardia sp. DSM 110487]